MTFTLTVLLSSVILASCMILIFEICIRQQWHLKYWTFGIIVFFITLKVFLPIDNVFSIYLPLDVLMNPLVLFFEIKILGKIYIYQITALIIGIGSIYHCIQFIKWIKEYHYIKDEIEKHGERLPLKDYDVYVTDYVDSAVTIGISGIILIPDKIKSKKEMEFAIQHEIAHAIHKDNLIKFIVNLLMILYWWFPLYYTLKKQMDLFFELRADQDVIRYFSNEEVYAYIDFLMDNQRKNGLNQLNSGFCSYLSFQKRSNFNYRIHCLIEKDNKQDKRVVLLFSFVMLLNLSIITPYYVNSSLTVGTYEISNDNAYIYSNGDSKQLFIKSNGENILTQMGNYTYLKYNLNLNENTSLNIPNYDSCNNKNKIRWKYRFHNGNLEIRKFNAYRNQWMGKWENVY